MAQVGEYLCRKTEALNSKPITTKINKQKQQQKRKREEGGEENE
jgi:hypothetical protein